ncbi:hypothetical protein [Flavisolibacter nicotianae]|uniref:hypothetical protein n=1 Tax=Flavisolibacter nicotianae TaxID=2364882 RepID=UPI000EB3D54B|nr:hypothetical protein [Flavisolibacter nicotianae]
MVSIVPNQFRIEGIVKAKEKDKQLDNFFRLLVKLENVEQLEGPGGFLDSSLKEIVINVVDTVAKTLREGMRIRCKIRKAPGRFFILPNSIQTEEMTE